MEEAKPKMDRKEKNKETKTEMRKQTNTQKGLRLVIKQNQPMSANQIGLHIHFLIQGCPSIEKKIIP